MWIFANGIGFLSIVEDNDDIDKLCVRARNRDHLESAFPAFDDPTFPDIVETPDGDYRWRITVERDEVMNLMMNVVEDIVYKTNVKGTVAGDDKELSKAMMSCWSAMVRYQDGKDQPWTDEPYRDDRDDDWEDEPEDDGPVVAVVQTKRADELSSAMADAVASISGDEE